MPVESRARQAEVEGAAQRATASLLVVAGHVSRALNELCERFGITHDQYNVLTVLREAHPEGRPRYEVGERLTSRAPDVTRLLDRLEDRGLVARTRAGDDRRLSLSTITPAGLQLLEAMAPEVRRVHERFADRLTAAELRELDRLCDALL
jgi:DNA-binding MarR family transcriptional regulator